MRIDKAVGSYSALEFKADSEGVTITNPEEGTTMWLSSYEIRDLIAIAKFVGLL